MSTKYIIAGPNFGAGYSNNFFGARFGSSTCIRFKHNLRGEKIETIHQNGKIDHNPHPVKELYDRIDKGLWKYIDESEVEKWIDENTWEYIGGSIHSKIFYGCGGEKEYCFKINRPLNKIYYLYGDKTLETTQYDFETIDFKLEYKQWKYIEKSIVDKWLADYKNNQIKSMKTKLTNFVILLRSDKKLHDIYVKIISDKGFKGHDGYNSCQSEFFYVCRKTEMDLAENCFYIDGKSYENSKYKHWPRYDGATQLLEILNLLEEKPAPIAPEIHGYKCEYTKNTTYVKFGCAQIQQNLFYKADDLLSWDFKTNGCNREISYITLCSGKTFNLTQIQEVIKYMSAVNEE